MKQCPYCGSVLNDDARFCVECGKLLPADAPAAAQPPVETPPAPVTEEPAPAAEAPADAPAFETFPAEEPAAEAPEAAPVFEAPAAPPVAQTPAAPPAEPVKPVTAEETEMPVITQLPPRKQMLSTFQYIALSLLYGLPVIGLIFLFVFGAGHPKNVSLKRFSAAMLILRLVFWILILAGLIVAMVKNGRLLTDALGQLVPAVGNLLKAIFA